MKRNLKEASTKSDGIYYIVYMNSKWRVEAFRRDEYGDVDHIFVWENYVVPRIADEYKLGGINLSILRDSYAGFPRGRIIGVGRRFTVYHGNNYAHLVTERDILKPFRISKAKFEFDDHERAIMQHRDIIRKLLHIETTWPAVR